MKKLLSLILFIVALTSSCDNRTPEQKAQDRYNAIKQDGMKRELYIDSLLNVAVGIGKYEFMIENRKNALRILKEEYPTMKERWDSIEVSLHR